MSETECLQVKDWLKAWFYDETEVDTLLSGKVATTDIVDNLTTNNASKVLSARQGKVLNDLIGDAITYINQ